MKALSIIFLVLTSLVYADGPEDNNSENIRPIPKHGVILKPEQSNHITNRLSELQSKIIQITNLKDPQKTELLPDVEIFYKVIHYCLNHD